ncbi:MAG: tetratricopeptide repeat protein [Candidatus Bathyarchaeota archaeon]|nr:tetratricopeptide repeat protein [Candidatus Bathyarchaeota archaeon]
MSEEKEDSVKLHKDGNMLYELGKYEEAKEKFLRASELYLKKNNFFDAASMLYKAGECDYMLKDHETALEYFLKSADLSFDKGFDRFGVSALEYARDCYEALENKEKFEETEKKIKEVKTKLAESF